MPTSSNSAIVRSRATALVTRWCRTIASMIWSPTVNTGLSDVIGSWKIMLMSRPRIDCICRSGRPTRSRPKSAIFPVSIRAVDDSSRMIESDVTLLPEPLSPTIPSTRPCSMRNEMSSTAFITPSSVWKKVRRWSTSMTGGEGMRES